ncbi:hypothetical protein BC827DRAFT_1228352 [Russula dissimulans]|nr:hypothetical protein BC827DRAFT_1228352 [Russula dissimulans]
MSSNNKRRHTPSPSRTSSPSRTPKALRVSAPVRLPLLCTLPPTCHLPNRPTPLSDSHALETHYATHHAHVCSSRGCGCIFPDARLLELHLTECHDPLAEIRRERGEKIFACHLSSCPRMFANPKARRLHLIAAHAYPKEYFFSVTNKGIGGLLRRWGDGASLLRGPWRPRDTDGNASGDGNEESPSPPRQLPPHQHSELDDEGDNNFAGNEESTIVSVPASAVHEATAETMGGGATDGDGDPDDAEVNALSREVSALGLVPSSVRFGRDSLAPRGRAGLATRSGRPAAHHIGHLPEANRHNAAANKMSKDHDMDRDMEAAESNAMEEDTMTASEKSPPSRGRRGRGRASGDGRGGAGGGRGMGRSRGFVPPPPRGGFLSRGAGRGFPRPLISATMRARGRGASV